MEELEQNPPVIPEPIFSTFEKDFIIGCDTLGQDKQVPSEFLDDIEKKLAFFKKIYEEKSRKMLLDDILAFIEE